MTYKRKDNRGISILPKKTVSKKLATNNPVIERYG